MSFAFFRNFELKYTFMMIVMKKFYLFVVCVLFVNHLFAKIKNGYEQQLEDSRSSLQSLNLLLLEDKKMSPFTRLQFKSKMESLIDYISFYELTDEFILARLSISTAAGRHQGGSFMMLPERIPFFVPGEKMEEYLEKIETLLLKTALYAHQNNRTRAAKELGLSRSGLLKKLKRIRN